jgi:hypothetical protein
VGFRRSLVVRCIAAVAPAGLPDSLPAARSSSHGALILRDAMLADGCCRGIRQTKNSTSSQRAAIPPLARERRRKKLSLPTSRLLSSNSSPNNESWPARSFSSPSVANRCALRHATSRYPPAQTG